MGAGGLVSQQEQGMYYSTELDELLRSTVDCRLLYFLPILLIIVSSLPPFVITPVMTFIRVSLVTIFDGGLVGEDEDDLKQVQHNTPTHLIDPPYQRSHPISTPP